MQALSVAQYHINHLALYLDQWVWRCLMSILVIRHKMSVRIRSARLTSIMPKLT